MDYVSLSFPVNAKFFVSLISYVNVSLESMKNNECKY